MWSSLFAYRNTHAAGRTFNHLHGTLEAHARQVLEFHLYDLAHLILVELADFGLVGFGATALDVDRLLDQIRHRRGLGDEGKRIVGEDGDLHRDDLTSQSGSTGVVFLDKTHNVDAVGANRSANRRRRIGLAGLQL